MNAENFAVLAPDTDSKSLDILIEILAGKGKKSSVVKPETIEEAAVSDAEVLVLVLSREPRRRQKEISDEVLNALRNRKVIGIGFGAAELFGKLGLEINSDATADASVIRSPKINVEKSSEVWKPSLRTPFVAYELPPISDPDAMGREGGPPMLFDDNLAMYVPKWSHHCSVVDVIARWTWDENYAPIARQGNHTLVGLAAPSTSWTPQYRDFFHDLAMSVHTRRSEPFTRAEWDITPPGTYQVRLAKCNSTDEPFSCTYYFKFARPTPFSAHLQHKESQHVMLFFYGDNKERWDRKDTNDSARQRADERPLEISVDMTEADLTGPQKGLWRLDIVNFDCDHAADCSLKIEYLGISGD